MKTVLVVDDHKIVLEGISNLLSKIDLVEKVITSNDAKKSLQLLNSNKVDLIISDLNMPGIDGFEFVSRVKKDRPNVPIIVLTMYVNHRIISKLEALDVDYIFSKDMDLDQLSSIISKILLIPFKKEKLEVNSVLKLKSSSDQYQIFDDHFKAKYLLTQREREILGLILQGKTSLEISKYLYISYGTVCCHRKSIAKKTGCKTSLELMKIYESLRN